MSTLWGIWITLLVILLVFWVGRLSNRLDNVEGKKHNPRIVPPKSDRPNPAG